MSNNPETKFEAACSSIDDFFATIKMIGDRMESNNEWTYREALSIALLPSAEEDKGSKRFALDFRDIIIGNQNLFQMYVQLSDVKKNDFCLDMYKKLNNEYHPDAEKSSLRAKLTKRTIEEHLIKIAEQIQKSKMEQEAVQSNMTLAEAKDFFDNNFKQHLPPHKNAEVHARAAWYLEKGLSALKVGQSLQAEGFYKKTGKKGLPIENDSLKKKVRRHEKEGEKILLEIQTKK